MESDFIDELVLYGAQGCEFSTVWTSLKNTKNVPPEKILKALSKNKSIELHNDQPVTKCNQIDNIRLNASLSIRKKNLTQEIKNPDATISDNVFEVLERIANKRHEGITQLQISNDLGLTSATTYTRVKRLESLGLIVRQPAVYEKTYTQMCYHVRFVPKDDPNKIISNNGSIQHEIVDRKMIQLLTDAKNHMLPLTELFNSMGLTTEKHIAWIRNHITKRVEQGIFEKVKVVSDNKRVVYLKWVAPLTLIKKSQKSNIEKKDLERANASLCGDALAEVILQHVEKNPGATTKDLYNLIPDAKWTNIRKMLHFSVQKDSKHRLFTIIESHGRVRQYRYFTRDGIKMYHQNRGENIELSDDNDQDTTSIVGMKRKRDNSNELASTQSQLAKKCVNYDRRLTESDDNSDNSVDQKQHVQEKSKEIFKISKIAGNAAALKVQPMKGSNITSNKRKRAIVTIVLRDRVREINNDLREEILSMTEDLNGAPIIARATLIRLADSLHASNTIRVVRSTVPIYGGGVENIILLLHPDLTQDHPDVKHYLDRLRTNKVVNPHPSKRKPIQEIYVNDDTEEESDLSQKQLVSRNIMHLAPEKHWREVAQRHGWIQSKWLRAKLLHEYLFSQHKDVIQLGELLNEMPLYIYCQIIGLYRHSEKVEEFMRTAQKDLALSHLPKNIENEMITSRYRLRSQLSVLIDILEALGLLKRVNITSQLSNNDSAVKLLNVGRIRNFSAESWPVVKTFSINALEDIHDFWTELQFVCTSSDTVKNIKPGHVLNTILMPHTWIAIPMLTMEQRNTLDRHLDHTQGLAPVEDTPLIVHLSKTLGLPQDRIRNYFHGFMRARNKQQKKKGNKSAKRAMVSKLIESGQTFEHAPSNFKLLPTEERTFAPTRKFIRNRYPRTSTGTPKQPPQRWPEVEHEALLHAYVIMRYRTETNGTLFSWAPISQVITNRNPSTCRRRISHLKEIWPRFDYCTEVLKRKWASIYMYGITSGELIDNRPWDWRDYDLLGQLEYFTKKLQTQHDESTTCFPSNVTLLKRQYDVSKSPLIKKKRRQATLGLHHCPGGVDSEGLPDSVLLASIVLRMVYMMPRDIYDAEKSRTLFRSFSENTMEQALQYLRSTGVLVIMRKNFNRLIPGQVYNVSEKFIRKFSSERLPSQILEQAKEFYSRMKDGDKVSVIQTPGTMAVLIDMISNDELCLNNTSAELLKIHQNVYYPRLKHDALINDIIDHSLNFSITLLNQLIIQSEIVWTPYNGNVNIPKMQSIESRLSQLPTQMQRVYSTLEHFGPSGATLLTLKEQKLNISDQDIIKSIDKLLSENLVCQIGFTDHRLVVYYHAPSWLIELKPGEYLNPRMWYNIDGSVNQNVFQGCARKIVLLITEKPGISLSQLQDVFQGYLTFIEIDDLIQYLVKNNVIKQETFTKERKTKGLHGLFNSAPLLMKTKKSNDIKKDIMVHYWLQDGYHYWSIK